MVRLFPQNVHELPPGPALLGNLSVKVFCSVVVQSSMKRLVSVALEIQGVAFPINTSYIIAIVIKKSNLPGTNDDHNCKTIPPA